MTWKQLRDEINKLTPKQLQMKVQIWGEDLPITSAAFGVISEEMWYDDGWDESYSKSEIPEEEFDSPTIKKLCDANTPFIWRD